MKISTILDHIDSGHMALPEFQRGYVWNRDQVRGLFDSLYRRHPVGGLLVWATLEMVERIRQEVRKVGFWKNQAMRDLLTRTLVRDLDRVGICRPGTERDLAQRLVALAKENHENLTRS